MNATAGPAISFQRYRRYSIGSLLGAIFSVGGRLLPRAFAGQATVVEREAVRHILGFLGNSALSLAATAFMYGFATAYAILNYSDNPEAFEQLVLPRLGSIFLEYVIPFAIANLVILKGVVGMTSDIASMRASQEVDAIESVGLHPEEMIFAPRALALIVAAPALAIVGVYVSGAGAWLLLWMHVRTAPWQFIMAFTESVSPQSLLLTIAKMAITGLVMALISGYFGFLGEKAEQGFIGRITTSAVSIAVLSTTIVNLFLGLLTALF